MMERKAKMKTHNSKGELTRYGLVHGGVDVFEKMGQKLTLQFKHGAFCVCQYSIVHRRIVADGIFYDLREARKFYNGRKAHIKSLCYFE
jgi:hypothetical protein